MLVKHSKNKVSIINNVQLTFKKNSIQKNHRLYIIGHLNDPESYDSDTSDRDRVKVEPMDDPEAVRDWTHFGNALIHAPKNPRPQRSG